MSNRLVKIISMSWFAKHELQNITYIGYEWSNESVHSAITISTITDLCYGSVIYFAVSLQHHHILCACFRPFIHSRYNTHTHNVVGWFLSIIKVYIVCGVEKKAWVHLHDEENCPTSSISLVFWWRHHHHPVIIM